MQAIEELLKAREIVVFDLETTGYSPSAYAKIIEIGAVKIYEGEIKEVFSTFINPEIKIPSKIAKLTHITDEMVSEAPTYEQVLPFFYQFIKNAVVVSHNQRFDWDTFITYYFQRLGLPTHNLTLDTMRLFKELYPGVKKITLNQMCQTLGVELSEHHRAIYDAIATAQCFLSLKEKWLANPKIILGEEMASFTSSSLVIYPTTQTQILTVRYWKKTKKKQEYHRWYVSLKNDEIKGTVYYDIERKTWYNKDFPYALNFEKIAQLAALYLGFQTVEQWLVSSTTERKDGQNEVGNAMS